MALMNIQLRSSSLNRYTTVNVCFPEMEGFEKMKGKLYQYQPEALMERARENQEMKDFIEMCFDPNSPVNGRLKEALFNMLKGAGEK